MLFTVAWMWAQGCHTVSSNHPPEWPYCTWRQFPVGKLKRRQGRGRDGLVRSKWPQGSHFPQCSNSPGTLVLICLLWAKVSETHCGHHGLEEIWQIQKTDPVCFSLLREDCVVHWYCMSLAVWNTSGFFGRLSNPLVKSQEVWKSYTLIKLEEFQTFVLLTAIAVKWVD